VCFDTCQRLKLQLYSVLPINIRLKYGAVGELSKKYYYMLYTSALFVDV
jgi:hypothetical protein